jgi:phage tail sheath protein FI
MAIQVTYPGVYIEEFAPGAPIEGVGTSTAAFLGPWKYGAPNEPKKLFSWDDFKREFGNPSGSSEPPADDDYLWYAVRGFFENGGRICYVTRVSNAVADSASLDDDAASQGGTPAPTAQATIAMRARIAKDYRPNPIKVAISHVNAVQSQLFNPTTTLQSKAEVGHTVIEVPSDAEARKFRPNDLLVFGTGSEMPSVVGVNGNKIRLSSPLGAQYAANVSVRLADPDGESTVLRFTDHASMTELAAGSVIKLAETTGTGRASVYATVKRVVPEVAQSLKTWQVTLQTKLGLGLRLSRTVTLESQEFDLNISGSTSGAYEKLSMNPGHPRYFASVINNDPNGLVYAFPVEPPNTTAVPFNRPKEITTANAKSLVGGKSEDQSAIGASDYENALLALTRIDDVNIVAAPGVIAGGVQQALITHCESMKDRFAVLDSPRAAGISGPGSVAEHRPSVDSASGYAALYYPWLRVSPAVGSVPLLVPPSGHVAGLYARIDNNRGVHKAPAGTEATLNGVLGVEKLLSDTEQGDLNMTYGINVVRVFQTGGRAIVWGARTTATNKNWQYVNIRRLFLFLEESIQGGIRWAVFEPNNLELWQKLKRTISAFLAQQWRDGALFGETEKDAFYVRVDEALNPPDQRALGRLTIEIGVKPSYPAEFIVVRIGIWQGGSDVTE